MHQILHNKAYFKTRSIATTLKRSIQTALISSLASIHCIGISHANELNLPELGSSASSIITPRQEAALGQQWLRAFRRQAPIEEDPLVFDYTESLITRLAYYSQLSRKSFDLILVDNKSFNAFAVPGNVIGINTGLFKYADSEDQLASVVAHELGHLSQRHYARTLEQQKEDQWKNIAAILGSLLVLAAAGGEEGVAAVTAAQASIMGRRLQYSRMHEQEADRIGISTMYAAGMNPSAAASMFEKLLVHSRYRQDIAQFDFLMTHPLTDTRVTDAFNQSRKYPQMGDVDSFQFHLMKNRLYALNNRPRTAIKTLNQEITTAKFPNASKYGLAIALLKDKQYKQANIYIEELYTQSPHEVAYAVLLIESLYRQGQLTSAVSIAEQQLALHPQNYPLAMALAPVSSDLRKPELATIPLYQIAAMRGSKTTPDIWYAISELEGIAGNRIEIHLARAEYYATVGAYNEGIKHLKFAEPLLEEAKRFQDLAKTKLRIEQFSKLKSQEIF